MIGAEHHSQKILITGATGLIGRHIAQAMPAEYETVLCASEGSNNKTSGVYGFDLSATGAIISMLDRFKPEVVIHTAAVTSVDVAEQQKDRAMCLNVDVTAEIASWCALNGSRLIHFSSDFVFDGERADYLESDDVKPLSWYGKTKAMSEDVVRKTLGNHVIIRPVLVYGYWPELSRLNFPLMVRQALKSGNALKITADQYRKPTTATDLARAVVDLLQTGFSGTLHLCGPQLLSISEFAREVARTFSLDDGLITDVASHEMHFAGQRPLISGFDCSLARKTIDWNPVDVRRGLQDMRISMQE